ncbi:maleylpyruvate isomerase family mycothiol-dependent enzyme [Nonomuraea jiangxiensis]|uniref:TIGR03083 family protein n=1 Tax=Nonomuraea jiangxiensis TaxID=633440 RepID=A0A1G8JMQ8_9ACTN|nr:maleylpyruvate isomerase family mycothiol-dependent enzyme [Nonomuraea jiangxiensis]SDI32456.1 TIGR03083 family protein [Nonomuraea jiangxiensis]
MDQRRYLELLELDYARMRETATRDLAAAVPSCPGWTTADLLKHVGDTFLHKVETMRRGTWPKPWPPAPDPSGPGAYLDRAMAELRGELTSRKPEEHALTWYDPDQTVGFWARRMALEAVVHRVDAELAAGEPITPIPADLAVDGIDEILVTFLAFASRQWPEDFGDALAGADGRSVSIAAGAKRRLVRLAPSGVEVSTDDTPGEASISGASQDVLLWLWGRADGTALTFDGDPELVKRLRDLLKEAAQ